MATMNYLKKRKLIIYLILLLIIAALFLMPLLRTPSSDDKKLKTKTTTPNRVVVAFTACGDRYTEALNMVKSILIFTRSPVHFVISADDVLTPKFNETLTKWRSLVENDYEFEFLKIKVPETNDSDWSSYNMCYMQRLFYPDLLPNIDALIYVDTDVLFLGPANHLWDFFRHFNFSQISALSTEDEDPKRSWYANSARIPFFGKWGLQAGVILMNLTRMRDFGWVEYMTSLMLKYKINITWDDQDIINIVFHYHPEAVMVLDCRHHYRTDHCKYGDACAEATRRGVFLIHGSRGSFHAYDEPGFEAVYQAIDKYELSQREPRAVLALLGRHLAAARRSGCSDLKRAFLTVPRETLATVDSTSVLEE